MVAARRSRGKIMFGLCRLESMILTLWGVISRFVKDTELLHNIGFHVKKFGSGNRYYVETRWVLQTPQRAIKAGMVEADPSQAAAAAASFVKWESTSSIRQAGGIEGKRTQIEAQPQVATGKLSDS